MRYPTPDYPQKLSDLFIPLSLAGALCLTAFHTLHFSNERGAKIALEDNGYTSIEIQNGPSRRRGDCDGIYLTHFNAIDKNGVQQTGSVCQSMFKDAPTFL